MSVIDERVSQLIAEIHDQPSPEEAFTKWMFIDILILDGLMMLFTIMFMVIRDIYFVGMVGMGSVAFGSVYLYMKDRAKGGLVSGRDFLDSQTIIGDLEVNEQIPVRAYDYVILPLKTIDGETVNYKRVDLEDTLGTLRVTPIRVGGLSELRPEVVQNLVRLRLKELKEIEEQRAAGKEKKDGRLSFLSFFTKRFRRKGRKIGGEEVKLVDDGGESVSAGFAPILMEKIEEEIVDAETNGEEGE